MAWSLTYINLIDLARCFQELIRILENNRSPAKILSKSLRFFNKILVKNKIIFYQMERFILGKFWTESWSEIYRINQFEILIDCVMFLLRSSSDVLINSNRILRTRFERNLDDILIWILSGFWNSMAIELFQDSRVSWAILYLKRVIKFLISW